MVLNNANSEFKQTLFYDVDVVEDVSDTIAKWRCRIYDGVVESRTPFYDVKKLEDGPRLTL